MVQEERPTDVERWVAFDQHADDGGLMEPCEAETLAMDLLGAASEARANESTEQAYHERNLAVAGFVTALDSMGAPVGVEEPARARLDDDDLPADWRCVWARLPAGLATWHLPVEYVPEGVPRRSAEYDGHDTEEKNRRVAEYAETDAGADAEGGEETEGGEERTLARVKGGTVST